MRATSQESLNAATERWEPVLRTAGTTAADYGQQLFGVVDTLDSAPSLRRALTDPSRDGEDKAKLATDVFGTRVSDEVRDLIAGLARGRWSGETDLAEALEELATTSLLAAAQSREELGSLEEEIFHLNRVLADNRELRLALSNREVPAARRVELLRSVIGTQVGSEALTLAARTIESSRAPSVASGLMRISELAAQRRRQLLAVVTTAVPLSGQQYDRLQRMLTHAYGRAMQVNAALDPSVVGGLQIQIGDEMVDATVLTRLDEARRRLAG